MNKRPMGILILALLNLGYAIALTFKLVSGNFEQYFFFGVTIAEKVVPTVILAGITMIGYIAIGFLRGTKSAWYTYLATVAIGSASKLVSDIASVYAAKNSNLSGYGYYREQANAIFNESIKILAITDALVFGIVFFIARYVYQQKRYFGVNGPGLSMPSELTDLATDAKNTMMTAKKGLAFANEITIHNYKQKVYLSAGAGLIILIAFLLLGYVVRPEEDLFMLLVMSAFIITCVLTGYLSVWQASISATFSIIAGLFGSAMIIAIKDFNNGFHGDDQEVFLLSIIATPICLAIAALGSHFGRRRMRKKIGEKEIELKPMMLANAGLAVATTIVITLLGSYMKKM